MEDKEEDRIPLRVKVFRLLVASHNSHGCRHDVYPALERDDLEQDKE